MNKRFQVDVTMATKTIIGFSDDFHHFHLQISSIFMAYVMQEILPFTLARVFCVDYAKDSSLNEQNDMICFRLVIKSYLWNPIILF